MGVKGLWSLLEPTKKIVSLESLSGQTLAVDLSIWIHQAIRGCAGGKNEHNAHLKVLFFRVCKLLFYNVRPIFVFDGPAVPYLKNLTLGKRRLKKSEAALQASRMQKKLKKRLEKLVSVKNSSLSTQKSETSDRNASFDANFWETDEVHKQHPSTSFEKEKDFSDGSSDDCEIIEDEQEHNIDHFDQDIFRSLPIDIQHEILIDARRKARLSSHATVLPKNRDDFSGFQLQGLLKRNQINRKLDELRTSTAALRGNFQSENVKQIFYGDKVDHFLLEKKSDLEKSLINLEDMHENSTSKKCKPLESIIDEVSTSLPDENDNIDNLANIQKIITFNEVIIEDGTAVLEGQRDSESPQAETSLPKPTHKKVIPNEEMTISNRNVSVKSIDNKLIEIVEGADDSSDEEDSFVVVEPKLLKPVVQIHLDLEEECLDEMEEECLDEMEEIDKERVTLDDDDKLDELNDAKNQIDELRAVKKKAEAIDRSMTSEMIDDCQKLIELFQLPCLKSCGEAEAQCAYMDQMKKCSAIISDDSDVWLFGASTVYRNVFNRKCHVEKYSAQDIVKKIGLSRGQLIKLAMLTGCDYSDGLRNVGVVTGLEILAEFKEFEGKEENFLADLVEFRKWYENDNKMPGNAVKSRLLKLALQFPDSFPDKEVYQAFLNPNVKQLADLEKEMEFVWPKLEKSEIQTLKNFAMSNFGWTQQKIDEMLLPAMEKFASSSRQTSMKNFAYTLGTSGTDSNLDSAKLGKRRLQRALDKMQAKQTLDCKEDTKLDERVKKKTAKTKTPVKPKKKRRRSKKS